MIIGVNGFKGSGKDTIGTYISEVYGFEVVKFAGKLYESVAKLTGVPESIWDKFKNDPDAEVRISFAQGTVTWDFRQFLQRYGTEAHRDVFGEGFWIESLLVDLAIGKSYVITDARFENELASIKALSGHIIQVIRPGVEGENHASEVAPPERLVDAVIYNSAGFEELYERVDKVMSYLGYEKKRAA